MKKLLLCLPLFLLAGCALFGFDDDGKAVVGGATTLGTLLGGPAGGAALGGLATLVYGVYQKATESKRHAKHSSAAPKAG